MQHKHSAPPANVPDATGSGCLIENAVTLIDGSYRVRLGSSLHPLLLNGEPVTSFASGWRPGSLFLGFSPLLLLEFHHDGGSTGYWFLDHRFEHMAASIPDLRADLRVFLRARALPVLRSIATLIGAAAPPPLGTVAHGFLRLSDATKQQIGHLLVEDVFPRPRSYLVSDFVAGGSPFAFDGDGEDGAVLAGARLAAGFVPEWQDRIVEAAASGTLRWPSPVDGAMLPCRGSIIFDDFHFLYRFVDERHALVFYAVVGDHRSCVGGVWFPSLGILVSSDDAQRGLGQQLAWHMPQRLMTNLMSWGLLVDAYLRSAPTGLANVLRGNPGVHIGHQLWNELTGISHLLTAVPEPRLLHLVLGRDSGLELYGPIDEIFPAIRGKVLRDFAGYQDMIASAYRSGTIVVRATRDRVSRALREQVMAQVHREAGRRKVKRPPGPVILFGLRVENRTLVDLEGFLHRLMAMIADRHPSLTVVFDGHNASGAGGGAPISSHGEGLARVKPHEIESRIVETLRTAFPQRRDRILDTIMRPVSHSLAWAQASCGFISIWGASLAKYRWVANLPGFVITSAHNLQHRHDLDIYHSPRYMESPTRLDFIEPALVTDLPEAEQLVPVGGSQRTFSNFSVDVDATLAAITEFLDSCLATAGRAGHPQDDIVG